MQVGLLAATKATYSVFPWHSSANYLPPTSLICRIFSISFFLSILRVWFVSAIYLCFPEISDLEVTDDLVLVTEDIMSGMRFQLLLLLAGIVWAETIKDACTNYLVSKGASADGSTMITYAADSHVLYGALYHYPAADHAPGEMREVIDWDSQMYLGKVSPLYFYCITFLSAPKIPEVSHTYNVIGNSNEYGLAIGETTFGGLPSLGSQPGAIIGLHSPPRASGGDLITLRAGGRTE